MLRERWRRFEEDHNAEWPGRTTNQNRRRYWEDWDDGEPHEGQEIVFVVVSAMELFMVTEKTWEQPKSVINQYMYRGAVATVKMHILSPNNHDFSVNDALSM